MNDYDKLLQESLPEDSPLKTPHSFQDRVFATNGHFMIDVPKALCEEEYQAQYRIKDPLIVTRVPLLDEPKVLDAQDIYSRLSAADIDFLTAFANCTNCQGVTSCECECGFIHECGICGGTGKRDSNANFAIVDGKPFQFQYFYMVLNIAEKFNNNKFEIISNTTNEQQTVFRIDKIRLTLMPVKDHHDRFIELV